MALAALANIAKAIEVLVDQWLRVRILIISCICWSRRIRLQAIAMHTCRHKRLKACIVLNKACIIVMIVRGLLGLYVRIGKRKTSQCAQGVLGVVDG